MQSSDIHALFFYSASRVFIFKTPSCLPSMLSGANTWFYGLTLKACHFRHRANGGTYLVSLNLRKNQIHDEGRRDEYKRTKNKEEQKNKNLKRKNKIRMREQRTRTSKANSEGHCETVPGFSPKNTGSCVLRKSRRILIVRRVLKSTCHRNEFRCKKETLLPLEISLPTR